MKTNHKKNVLVRGMALLLAAVLLLGVLMLPVAAAETEATVATIPADGNPEDETAKGTYTASDEEVIAAADMVVARMGDYTLTNSELQVYYWMEVQSFLSSYGSYAAYFGLDYTKPLDTQICGIADNQCTWQQFFLAGALNSWKSYRGMSAEAEKNGFELTEELRAEIDAVGTTMEQNAAYYGLANAEELLATNAGKGTSMEDYMRFVELNFYGTAYFEYRSEQLAPTDEEVEAYFTENEQTYEENGLVREDKYVNVRHVLIMPEGADSSTIRTETFPDEAWEASQKKAAELLAQWEKGDKSEDSFAQLAMENSQDGSAANGGLYTDVAKGQMVEAFENWCFDETRQAGDYGIVETEFGYHLMFFVSSRPVYVDYVREEMINQRSNEMLNEVLGDYVVEADFENILLGYVDLGGGSAEESQSAEIAVQAEPLFTQEDMPVLVISGVSILALIAAAYVLNKKEH